MNESIKYINRGIRRIEEKKTPVDELGCFIYIGHSVKKNPILQKWID